MRRSHNMGRGGGGGNLNMSGGGPLLTEHLKDIDLELELLKRKREMLEQQQFLQPFNQQSQRSYSQQPYSYNQNEPKQGGGNCDFSHLYNDGPQQYRKPFGKKRQSDGDWHHDSFPKRSAGQGGRGPSNSGPAPVRNPRPYSGAGQSKAPFKYGQGKQSIGQKISNQKSQRADKKYVASNKITKPTKAFAPPNKIASQPVAARKDLVAAAIKSVADAENRDREALRLLPDKVPTKQMTGRMELALGAILRDIREKCAGPYEDALRPANIQRVIKQAIRERIRSAMLGKIIGATQEIIKEYRDKYPKETDNEILNKALEEAGIDHASEIKIEKAPTPNDYFRQNLCKLINGHLTEIFSKMEEIYNPPAPKVEIDFTEDNVEPGTEPQVQPQAPEETAAEKPVENETTPTEAKPEENEAAPTEAKPEENKAKPEENEAKPNEAKPNEAKANDNKPNEEALANMTPNDYKRMLPRLLKRHIPTIIKLLNVNKMYRSAVADLTTTTRAMFTEYEKKPEPVVSTPTQATERPARLPPYVLPYYVKVMGKPQLPKKKVMHTFLEVFNPKSIKKHRNIHNLLFIGFSTKEDFDGIVKADGTVIGRSTLSIRVCDRNSGKSDDKNAVDLTTDGSDDPLNDSDVIGTELDGKIDELLTSIRKTEEGEQNKQEGDADNKEGTENSQEEFENKIEEETEGNNGIEEVNAENMLADENDDDDVTIVENVSNGNEIAQENNGIKSDVEEVKAESEPANGEKNDQVSELKVTGRSTPTRASARLSTAPVTPGSVRTRRASRLLQN